MKFIYSITFVLISLIIVGCSASQFSTFITAKKDKLYDGEKEFRFISFNIPNLHYIEDYLRFDETNPWRLPDEFEIRDALTSIKQMGGRVARTYVISVKRSTDSDDLIRHVEGPGKFNEEAFVALDKVLQIANEVGVRVIIPFVDNWQWMGGKAEYAAFREKEPEEFWTDSLLISDFKKTIDFVLNRKNTFTGVLYKDDMSVLGWETGNELECPFSWTSEIARYIKSIDRNHLVIEGTHSPIVSEEAIEDTNIDVLSTHYYEPAETAIPKILENKKLSRGVKPYFVGEFGFIPSREFESIIDSVISNDVSGALLWSLRFRNKEGGFYKHYEQLGFAAYNWTGFSFNNPYSEKSVLKLIRNKAHKINDVDVTILPKPAAPKLLPTNSVYSISWQGATGAFLYVVQRSENNDDWETIDVVDDNRIAYRPLFADISAKVGNNYFYRIFAWNGSQISDASNVIGPINVTNKKIVDEMFDDKFIFSSSGEIKFLSMENVRQAKEDRSRLTGGKNSFIIYRTETGIKSFQVDIFLETKEASPKFFISGDLNTFEEITAEKNVFNSGKNDYGFFIPVRYTSNINSGKKYLKIELEEGVQISRSEIEMN